MDLLANIEAGLLTAIAGYNLFYCFLGVFLGMLIGVVPGIGALAAISMLFPITYHLEPTSALIMLAGIFYGTAYGGSTAAILLNVPGTPSSAIVCLDGYPMAKQGRAGVALFMTTLSSFVAGSIGIVLMMIFSPLIVNAARHFNSAEYFSLMILGLIAASTISSGSTLKAISMVVLGILFGTVGMDMYTGVPRFNFGTLDLMDGLSLVAFAMGLFGMAEVISSIGIVQPGEVRKVSWRSMLPTRSDVSRSILPTLRGTAIGSFFGTLPGTGATIASFMSYALEKRVAKDPSRFGQGAIEGVVAPEAANNAADQTAFIPTMTLGIPGSATMALLLGVLIVHGISPGPLVMVQHPEMFWGLVMSFWIGNVMLVVLNIPLIGIWVRLLQVPYHYLYPAITMFILIGVYSVNRSIFDVWIVLFFGLTGYAIRVLGFPAAPLLLGFVLGPLLEEHFRRAMLLSQGDLMTFVERPVSGVIMAITFLILIWSVRQARSKDREGSLSS
ncbi:tripartite tricarboxylate transporter permease [Mesorhizobium sp. CAU 1741]|uniref:tripartite tricarboxylate transporter permease n=1 Tax=Mesorhizobium sp. CAU 1741 TaxID=3140366 RepID=UPI00325AEF28